MDRTSIELFSKKISYRFFVPIFRIEFSNRTFVPYSYGKKQPTVALSSTEAEYRAACSAATEAIWLWRLLQELCAPQSSSTLIWCDNQSCIAIAKNPVFHARTKHIEVHYHYVREQILSGNLHVS